MLYHVGGLAFFTLLINAPTTGLLVKKLKLIEKTEVQKQMLEGVTRAIEKNTESNIEELKSKKFFNQVEWSKVVDIVELKEFKEKYKVDPNHASGHIVDDQVDSLEMLNKNIKRKSVMPGKVNAAALA